MSTNTKGDAAVQRFDRGCKVKVEEDFSQLLTFSVNGETLPKHTKGVKERLPRRRGAHPRCHLAQTGVLQPHPVRADQAAWTGLVAPPRGSPHHGVLRRRQASLDAGGSMSNNTKEKSAARKLQAELWCDYRVALMIVRDKESLRKAQANLATEHMTPLSVVQGVTPPKDGEE